MSKRPSVTIGIQPQIALYTVILGGVCAIAGYTEKYRRNQENIDDEIKARYSADIRDSRERMPQMTARIRGQDEPWLDKRMDKLVWGGKAHLDEKEPLTGGAGAATGGGGFGGVGGGGGGPASYAAASRAAASNFDDDTSDDDDSDDDVQKSKKLKKERKRRKRKDKKSKPTKGEEQEVAKLQSKLAAQERQKLVVQSAVGGIVVGAAAVGASVLFGSRK
eukprot:CAMPEP_0113496592 /NCGR_PEP_ID=MMETSP0014_2-20120614/30201_1 /TAXON_ID=2857 /ORGANISM="Nitzschia sp." /LENGTH=219 /DNA_ID=CAMNT_0000390519 /DNA_START=339 /DNA_END=998 /DNA_ORIENTATION=+ /assembly_acc=CAM_ASM_000159